MTSTASTTTNPTDGVQGGSSHAPTPLAARAAIDVIAITSRDEFLLELGQVLGGQASITPVETSAEALEHLGHSKRLQILMIDSRDLANLSADVVAVQARAPQIPVLVFAESDKEQAVASTLKGSNVFAVLPVPVDARKTAAIFGGAVADTKARPPANPTPGKATIVLESLPTAAPEPIRPVPRDRGGSNSHLRLAGGLALALVAGIALWLITRGGGVKEKPGAQPPAPTPVSAVETKAPDVVNTAPPAVETSLLKGKVDELLERARNAMRERRYTEPAGDNALLYYRSAAAADATNGEALDGLKRVAAVLTGRFDDAMNAAHYEEAASALAQLKSAVPADAQVGELQLHLTSAQISKALAEENPERATALLRAVQQSNSIPAAQLTKWRADIGRLQDEVKEKRAAEQQAAREAAAAEQKKARDVKAAAAEAERKAQADRDKENQEKVKAAQLAAATQDAAKANQNSSAARSTTGLQSLLKRKRYFDPEYPHDALAKGIGGSVTLAFTVDVNGETRDWHVESSEPAGVFDKATIAAVRRWRYEPLLIDGTPTEVPARIAIRFAPPPQ